jgi:hypothetical protein
MRSYVKITFMGYVAVFQYSRCDTCSSLFSPKIIGGTDDDTVINDACFHSNSEFLMMAGYSMSTELTGEASKKPVAAAYDVDDNYASKYAYSFTSTTSEF